MELKYYDQIESSDRELYNRREKLLSNVVDDFYAIIKNKSNVLSSKQVCALCDKTSFFGTTIWENKTFMKMRFYQGKELRPVIFGLSSGIIFERETVYFLNGKGKSDYWDLDILWIGKYLKFEGNEIKDPRYSHMLKIFNQEDILILKDFLNNLNNLKEKFNNEIDNEKANNSIETSNEKVKLIKERDIELNKLDLDGDGEIDLIDYGDFNKLLQINQKKIIEIDKIYIHKFIKLFNYIKEKNSNLKSLYKFLKTDSKKVFLREKTFNVILNNEDLYARIELIKSLRNQVHTYDLFMFHSLNMITSLVKGDLITFYEIYEIFDKLGIYNSSWENEVAQKLTNIGDKLDDLIYSIDKMEQNIVSEISNLNYVIQDGFGELTRTVNTQLAEIDSSIKWNTLVSVIQTYQLYKINKQTKPLLPK